MSGKQPHGLDGLSGYENFGKLRRPEVDRHAAQPRQARKRRARTPRFKGAGQAIHMHSSLPRPSPGVGAAWPLKVINDAAPRQSAQCSPACTPPWYPLIALSGAAWRDRPRGRSRPQTLPCGRTRSAASKRGTVTQISPAQGLSALFAKFFTKLSTAAGDSPGESTQGSCALFGPDPHAKVRGHRRSAPVFYSRLKF